MQYGMYNTWIREPFSNYSPNTYCHKEHTMLFGGKGIVSAIPDQAILTVGIVSENEQLQHAQQENAEQSNQVIESLKKLGIDDRFIQTTVYTIQPLYDYVDGKTVFRGYQVEHQLEVTITEIPQIGLVYNNVFSNGANRSGGLRFSISARERYEREALKIALSDAREKAESIASSIGVTVNQIPVKIWEQVNMSQDLLPTVSYKVGMESHLATTPPIQKGIYDCSKYKVSI